MELTVQNVYGLLLRSKLLPQEEAQVLFARWQEENKEQVSSVARFAGWMVSKGYLTEYQATLLARGYADGLVLGEYKILERLGKGRMAGVYKAQHRSLGQQVAIKVLPPSHARDETLRARFLREARLAIRLHHPNIVRAFHMGSNDELLYLVMEYLDGETLHDVLQRRGKFSPAEAVRLVYQALQGLQHIHERGLVHRDIKPSNLMLVPAPRNGSTFQCTVKILDIGLGRVANEDKEEPDQGLTAEGVLLGTPDYMAPEQARDPRNCDIRADIYSLGCVLYHLLAGHPPFPDTNIISQMIRHASETPQPLKDINPQVVDGLQQIVGWMMEKDPDKRYATPSRAASALEVYLTAESVPLSNPDIDPQMQPYLNWLRKEQDVSATQPEIPTASLFPPSKPAGPIEQTLVPTGDPVARAATRGAGHTEKAKIQPAGAGSTLAAGKTPNRQRKKHRSKKTPTPSVSAPPALPARADSLQQAQVELVALAPPGASQPSLREFSRRDLLFFLAGIFSGVLAILIGQALASLLRGGRSRNSDPEVQQP